MQDPDLFMELAAIAGVFVGFGALIAVRSGATTDVFEVAWMRGVVSIGLLAVLAALAPVVGCGGASLNNLWANIWKGFGYGLGAIPAGIVGDLIAGFLPA